LNLLYAVFVVVVFVDTARGASCNPPYQPVSRSLFAKCAYINDTTGGTISYKLSQMDCQKNGGQILRLDTNDAIQWMKSQSFEHPCWFGPALKEGCPFMFNKDYTNSTDKDCDGARGFARYNVKCYACEQVGGGSGGGGSNGGRGRSDDGGSGSGQSNPSGFCPAQDTSKDCPSNYDYETTREFSLNDCSDHCDKDKTCQSFTYAPNMRPGKNNCFLKSFACDKFTKPITMSQDLQNAGGLHYYKCASTVRNPPRVG